MLADVTASNMDRPSLDSRLNRMCFPVFQPIRDRDGKLFYYEGCVRVIHRDPDAHAELLGIAEKLDFVDLIDLTVSAKVVDHALQANTPAGFNLSVMTIERRADELMSLIARARHLPGGVVVEITETVAIKNVGLIADFCAELRKWNARVALDDVGTGNFEVQDVLALRPDIVKIAMPRTHQVMRDVAARAWLQSIMAVCNSINADVVAEGIDRLEYRDSLRLWNVPYFQGYAIGMPQILMKQNDQEAAPTSEMAAPTAVIESNTNVLYRAERVA